MTVTAVNYAKTLYDLSVSRKVIQNTKEIFREVPELAQSLKNPLVPFEIKEKVIANSREKSGRKPGGQPGHKGYSRKK